MTEFGELLRHARAYKGVSLREAERATKINRHHLAALEREEFDDLPPLIYARGIVRNYAQYLGLDPVAVLAMFEEIHGQRSGGFRVVPAVKPLDIPSHWAPNFAIIAFMVVMSAVIFAWLYSAYFAPPDVVPTTTTTQGQVTLGAEGAGSAPAATATMTPLQGGGAATPQSTATATATATTVATATPTEVATATATPTITPSPTPSEHQFAITVTNHVWVNVTVDGQEVLSTDLPAGTSRGFKGQTMTVSSGNAAYILVSVDGVDQGALGTSWDASKTYPTESSP